MRKLSVLRRLPYLLAACLVSLSIAAAAAQERPKIAVVNQALSYLAEELVGDAAEIIFPIPAGADPSFWRPSIADISTIQSADLILLNGAGFAGWVDRVSLPRSKTVNTSANIEDQFITTESITHSHGDGGEHSHEGLASYLWLDPVLALAQAEAIAAALIARNLAGSDVEANLSRLRSELTALDIAAQISLEGAAAVPMIATHPRYQYFARRYGLSITSLEWEAGAMPTEGELDELEMLASELGARVIIWEAAPPQDALDAATRLGLESVIFPPLASQSDHPTYTAAFEAAVDDIAQAAARASD